MKRDPYHLIRSIIARRMGGVTVKPLPAIVKAHPIVLVKRARVCHTSSP